MTEQEAIVRLLGILADACETIWAVWGGRLIETVKLMRDARKHAALPANRMQEIALTRHISSSGAVCA